ncbi:MAG: sigma-70 family RNA polymerase sigma factor [Christensenella sp.]|uniref:sigma-70 family RNA polymerase sigma factor n=1 Tax=Christensenella sp. TaxID=1935934 RepID=UPI002B21083E|nr:sigma-70 family RNA polymerase sigma factor [Christensenella sp.]MEA5002961.1 sigma-70 family RNA polymerase sigma factor [Christensenella sp.]
MKSTPVLDSRRKTKSELIESHLDVVSILACKYANYQVKKEELVSVGSIGLIKAAESYDATKNVKFSTYASTCIKNEMLMYLRSNLHAAKEISLDETMARADDDLKLEGLLGTDKDTVWDVVERQENQKLLEEMLTHLSAQQQEIMNYRFGLKGYPEKTQKEVAHLMGLSQSYISKVEKQILSSMRNKVNVR